MKHMKVHISGPMTGVPDLNATMFGRAHGALMDMGHEPWCPLYEIPVDVPYREALARNLDFICNEADAICQLPCWLDSPGALAEYHAAKACRLHLFRYFAKGEWVLDYGKMKWQGAVPSESRRWLVAEGKWADA